LKPFGWRIVTLALTKNAMTLLAPEKPGGDGRVQSEFGENPVVVERGRQGPLTDEPARFNSRRPPDAVRINAGAALGRVVAWLRTRE
jgi:hypothetical protein